MEEWAFKRKINLLGDVSVGKTSLVLRYVKNLFGDDYLKTIGTNVYKKQIDFESGRVVLMINDIMGEKTFRSVQEGAFRGSSGAIAVADITRSDTYDSLLEDWLPRYKKFTDEDESIKDKSLPMILVVNKYDLADEDMIKEWEDRSYEIFDDMVFSSAKTGKNVEYIFSSIAARAQLDIRFSVKDMKEVISKRTVETPGDLLDVMLALCSFLGDIPYERMEEILTESGIDKFGLIKSHEISEIEVIRFTDKLLGIYKKKDDEYAISIIDMALGMYLQ